MPASMIVGRGEVKAMATKQKESQTITKELAYLLSRLCTVEATTMRVRLSRLVGRCGVTAFRFLSLSLLLSPHSGSILDPWTACNINYARIRIARGEKKVLGCASTRGTLRIFHTYTQRPQREIPHLRKCPYKEGVGNAHCEN